MHDPIRLAVLLSGSGTTLQNLLDRIAAGTLQAEIACVVSNKAGSDKPSALRPPMRSHSRRDTRSASRAEASWIESKGSPSFRPWRRQRHRTTGGRACKS